MLDQGRISSVQLLFLLILTDFTTAFLFGPTVTSAMAGPDAWLVPPVAGVYGLLVALVCLALARRFPEQVFTEYLPSILGKIPGKLLAALFTLGVLHIVMVILGESAQYVHTAFYRETPPLVVDILLMMVVVYGVSLGIEVIARQGNITFPIWIISYTTILLLVVKDIDLGSLMPILENGPLPVLQGSLVPAAWRGEIFFLLMLYPYLNRKTEALKTSLWALAFLVLMPMLTIGTTVALFGDQFASRTIFPVHNLARYISVGGILQRIELYLFVIWVAGVIVKLAVFMHVTCIAAASTLGLKNYRSTIIPLSVAAITGSFLLYETSYIRLSGFLTKVWPYYAGVLELLLPGLVLLLAIITKKRAEGFTGDDKTLN